MTDAPVLCLVRDLLFMSKITASARKLDISIKTIRDPAKLAGEIGKILIVDLNQENALPAAVAWRQENDRPVVGFVSHVDTQKITDARAAGIDRIFARSQFEQHLPDILRG